MGMFPELHRPGTKPGLPAQAAVFGWEIFLCAPPIIRHYALVAGRSQVAHKCRYGRVPGLRSRPVGFPYPSMCFDG